jgi:cell division protein FtsI (penicillin-binding protein 3)
MNNQQAGMQSSSRIRIWYALIVCFLVICVVRLFYLQIIKHDYYKASAQSDQYKEYEIAASRGVIKAYDGGKVVPIVLSQQLYTVYADPQLVKNAEKTALRVQEVIGGDAGEYKEIMQLDNRYGILAKRVTPEQKDALLKLKLPGVAAQGQDYRTYPQGVLAAQVLGFVDDAGAGKYGLEQALNKELRGSAGLLKAVTDVSGVPLAASQENIRKRPVPGKNVVLTIDIGMQKQVEQLLKQGLDNAKSQSGSVVVMEAKTGAVRAMANYPTYDPANYAQVENANAFNNTSVTEAIEVGSVMKPLTAATALHLGVVRPSSTFYDPSKFKIDDAVVSNVEEDGGPGTKDVADILNLSLNTGATWLVMQMGKKGELNKDARVAWHNGMVNQWRFGQKTGIEQGYESPGYVPSPTEGYGLNIMYANTSFGQAMTATTLQMAGAYAAMLNGGTYYQPHLVDSYEVNGALKKQQPKVLAKNVVTPQVSEDLQDMMEYVVDNHRFARKFDNKTFSVGGKTGTAQIANPAGGYLEDEYNGTYTGFVGGDEPKYIISIRVDKPKIPGYAGSQAAQPLFGLVGHMLIDNFNVPPKSAR